MERHNEDNEYATGPYAHHIIKEYVCQWCGERFQNVKEYDEHRTEEH